MKYIFIIISCVLFFLITSCNTKKTNKTFENESDKYDTLKLGFLDTFLLGHQTFPKTKNKGELKNVFSENILLTFLTDDYCYIFFNKDRKDFLSSFFWEKYLLNYINNTVGNNSMNSKFERFDYKDGPFLTGFYNTKDSIIVSTNSLRKNDVGNSKELSLSYFSTSDTLLKLNKNISVGVDLNKTIEEFNININPKILQQEGDFKIVLLEAISQIDNAWYNDALYNNNNEDNIYSDYSICVILSFKDKIINRIEFIDYGYMEYVLKQQQFSSKDIHLH